MYLLLNHTNQTNFINPERNEKCVSFYYKMLMFLFSSVYPKHGLKENIRLREITNFDSLRWYTTRVIKSAISSYAIYDKTHYTIDLFL